MASYTSVPTAPSLNADTEKTRLIDEDAKRLSKIVKNNKTGSTLDKSKCLVYTRLLFQQTGCCCVTPYFVGALTSVLQIIGCVFVGVALEIPQPQILGSSVYLFAGIILNIVGVVLSCVLASRIGVYILSLAGAIATGITTSTIQVLVTIVYIGCYSGGYDTSIQLCMCLMLTYASFVSMFHYLKRHNGEQTYEGYRDDGPLIIVVFIYSVIVFNVILSATCFYTMGIFVRYFLLFITAAITIACCVRQIVKSKKVSQDELGANFVVAFFWQVGAISSFFINFFSVGCPPLTPAGICLQRDIANGIQMAPSAIAIIVLIIVAMSGCTECFKCCRSCCRSGLQEMDDMKKVAEIISEDKV
jgi:hypothetical protein